MKRLQLMIPTLLAAAVIGTPASSQEFWKDAPFEGETERHEPTQGMEYEYEYDDLYGYDVEAEREQYEWEPGEGYHEQEWYDPSDWFEFGSDIDYEHDLYDYGYAYDEYEYQDGYGYGDDAYDDTVYDDSVYDDPGYDYYSYDYDYAFDGPDVTYQFDQQVTGRVERLERMRGSNGAPRSVQLTLQTQDGQMRTLQLGDVAYVNRNLPALRRGDEVVIGGEFVDRNGQRMFRAKEIRSGDEAYLIPDYEYRRQIQGELEGLRKVRVQDGDVEMVLASVRTEDGEKMNIQLGRTDEMNGLSRTMRRGAKVRVDGYRRKVDGRSGFVVQDFKVVDSPEKNRGDQRQARDGKSTSRGKSQTASYQQPNRDRQNGKKKKSEGKNSKRQSDKQGQQESSSGESGSAT